MPAIPDTVVVSFGYRGDGYTCVVIRDIGAVSSRLSAEWAAAVAVRITLVHNNFGEE